MSHKSNSDNKKLLKYLMSCVIFFYWVIFFNKLKLYSIKTEKYKDRGNKFDPISPNKNVINLTDKVVQMNSTLTNHNKQTFNTNTIQ